MKRCSACFVFSEMQIEITMKLYFISTRLAKVKKKKSLATICENVEKQGRISHHFCWSANWFKTVRQLSNKLKSILLYFINRNKGMEGKLSLKLSLDVFRSQTVLRRKREKLGFILCWGNSQWPF